MHNISKLKTEFQEIVHLSTELVNNKTVITQKVDVIKEQYNNLTKTNTKKIFIFCLDSFYFQYKLLHLELQHYTSLVSTINNRMYGDYYKLYSIMLMQCKENNIILSKKHTETDRFPIYKDLEPFLQYSLEDIIKLHEDILSILNELYVLYVNKHKNLEQQNDEFQVGMSITNYFNTLSYENSLLKEQIGLYTNYLMFYHNSQKNYFIKLLVRIKEFMRELENEILVDNRSIYSRINGEKEFMKGPSMLNLSNTTDISLEDILNDSEKIVDANEFFINKIENLVVDISMNSVENIEIIVDELNKDIKREQTEKDENTLAEPHIQSSIITDE
jgi:hypothetical protein